MILLFFGGILFDLFGLQSRGVLALFLVRMDAKIDLHSFALGCGFDHAADGGSGEALPSDECGNIWLAENETEVHLVFARVSNPKLGELGVFDELQGDVLDEILNLCGDFFHGGRFFRSVSCARENEQDFFFRECGVQAVEWRELSPIVGLPALRVFEGQLISLVRFGF